MKTIVKEVIEHVEGLVKESTLKPHVKNLLSHSLKEIEYVAAKLPRRGANRINTLIPTMEIYGLKGTVELKHLADILANTNCTMSTIQQDVIIAIIKGDDVREMLSERAKERVIRENNELSDLADYCEEAEAIVREYEPMISDQVKLEVLGLVEGMTSLAKKLQAVVK